MKVFTNLSEFRSWRRTLSLEGKTVGFIPTMGAIHSAHMSLVHNARRECDVTIVSIFVNPAQFAPNEDYDSYPRKWDADRKILESSNIVDAFLLPSVSAMYPAGINLEPSKQFGTFVEVNGISHQLEGRSRPNFFRGVATVCVKLFNIVHPDKVYFGQKDVQQTVIIKAMVRDLLYDVDVRVCPTERESDGLAISSRNIYLKPSQRTLATTLWKALSASQERYASGERATRDILQTGIDVLRDYEAASNGELEMEYYKLSHPLTLEEVKTVDDTVGAILSGAVRIGEAKGKLIRLIDNIYFVPHSD